MARNPRFNTRSRSRISDARFISDRKAEGIVGRATGVWEVFEHDGNKNIRFALKDVWLDLDGLHADCDEAVIWDDIKTDVETLSCKDQTNFQKHFLQKIASHIDHTSKQAWTLPEKHGHTIIFSGRTA